MNENLTTMKSVDVVILTKNSERLLRKCIDSVYRNVPLNSLIVVDGYSNDSTMQIVKEFQEKHGNVIFVQDRGTRGSARQKAMSKVKTDWFMFVDSDVVLCKDWFKKAIKYRDSDVGAIWGIEVWSVIQNPATLKMFLWITKKIFEIRGGTHDTLVRRDVMKDIEIPNDLHVFEDAYIKEWITKKGYKVIACYDPYCIHYRPRDVWTLHGILNMITDAIRFGNFRIIAKLALAYGFYAAYSVYRFLVGNIKH